MSLVGFKSKNHPQQVDKRGANPERDGLGTDPALFAELDQRFHFTLDVAASRDNAKCEQFFTEEDDGLSQPWSGRVWCNPPYSDLRTWVATAWREAPNCEVIVMLVPANRCEQKWWQEYVEPFRDREGCIPLTTEFLAGRRRFVKPGQEAIGPNERPPFGCCLLIWKTR